MREEADGKALARAKVIARLLELSTDDIFRPAERARWRSARMSALGPGCVKTFIGSNFGEMNSPLHPFHNNFQHVSHLIGWNADRTSNGLDRVDVFTQLGP